MRGVAAASHLQPNLNILARSSISKPLDWIESVWIGLGSDSLSLYQWPKLDKSHET